MVTYLSNQNQAVLGQSTSCMRSAHCGRAAGPWAHWRQASTLLPGLAPEPQEVTVAIAAGRREKLYADSAHANRIGSKILNLLEPKIYVAFVGYPVANVRLDVAKPLGPSFLEGVQGLLALPDLNAHHSIFICVNDDGQFHPCGELVYVRAKFCEAFDLALFAVEFHRDDACNFFHNDLQGIC